MLIYMEGVNMDIVLILFWVRSKQIKRIMSQSAGVIEFLDLPRGGKKVYVMCTAKEAYQVGDA